MAYFLRLEVEGDSLFDFLRVPVPAESALSSKLEKVGQPVVLRPSSPADAPLARRPVEPLP